MNDDGIKKRTSLRSRLIRLINGAIIPMLIFGSLLLALMIAFNSQNANISHNITTASRFNQSFKNDVDLKLYCYAAGTIDELPYDEVAIAKNLAENLMASTRNKESRRAIGTVLNLCGNLEKCMDEMQVTESYDERMEQLDTNMYIITELLQTYIYTYLYYEAGQMATMQTQQNTLVHAVVVFAVIAMAVIVISTIYRSLKISRSITQPVDKLYTRVTEIGRGNLTPQEPVKAEDEKMQTLSSSIEKMVLRINSQMEQNQLKQIRIREMELALIQAQINPHFLYNTLDTIIWLIETEKYSQAQDMVGSLSTYFRSFLSNGRDIITLKEELNHVRSYLEIQQVRYKDILTYEFNVDERFSECLIPKLTLQPLIENAIYHGIKLKRGGGKITISVSEDGSMAKIEVADTGAGMDEEQLVSLRDSLKGEPKGFGLASSYKRLELKYSDRMSFDINSTKTEGTIITIRIPVSEKERVIP